ncbi:hypothetical protein [Limimaricola cinnabarinus]|uniref:Uncharacterized protein n=1 Tax=Limimaricola cinnabarinus TaxID=1125964 RepID=A0A2G1MH48_9RHOB|nr:hypothetical protein [Limimaricola cinnabarinus]PHP28024.1 hypothetical protein CJ301_08550 [Limimaricola cinnabarinus]
MTALPDIPFAYSARPANEPRPPASVEDRRSLAEIETLAGALENLDDVRQRSCVLIDAGARLVAQPDSDHAEAIQPEDDSLEYRIMSGLAALIGGVAIVMVGIFAISLIADLPKLLTRGIAP